MPNAIDLQKKKLQDDVALAELRATLATKNKEAAKATLDAQQAQADAYKGPAVTAPTGAITAETPFIETQVLANRLLARALQELATKQLQKLPNATQPLTLLLLNPLDLPALTLYATVSTQLALLTQDYEQATAAAQALLHPPVAAQAQPPARAAFLLNPVQAGAAAAGVVRTAADLASLFLTTTTYKNADLTLTDTLVAASFVQAVKQHHASWHVFASAVFPPHTLAPRPASAFLAKLDALRQTDQQSTDLQQQLQAATSVVPALPELQLTRYTAALATLAALHTAYHDLRLQLTATAGQSILEAERLAALYGAADTYVVKLQATSKGSMRLVHRLFRNDKLTFSAGTELSYLVIAPSGEISQGGSIWKYQDYIEASEINTLG